MEPEKLKKELEEMYALSRAPIPMSAEDRLGIFAFLMGILSGGILFMFMAGMDHPRPWPMAGIAVIMVASFLLFAWSLMHSKSGDLSRQRDRAAKEQLNALEGHDTALVILDLLRSEEISLSTQFSSSLNARLGVLTAKFTEEEWSALSIPRWRYLRQHTSGRRDILFRCLPEEADENVVLELCDLLLQGKMRNETPALAAIVRSSLKALIVGLGLIPDLPPLEQIEKWVPELSTPREGIAFLALAPALQKVDRRAFRTLPEPLRLKLWNSLKRPGLSHLTPDYQAALIELARSSEDTLALEAINAFVFAPLPESARPLKQAARECRTRLELASRDKIQTDKLLRASAAPAAPPDTLLRPAHPSASNDPPDTLLRGSEKK